MREILTFASLCAALAVSASNMMTPWGEKVTSENAWRGYPRPQMVRKNWTCLNGDWDYAIDAITNALALPGKVDGKIRVPFALESPLSGCGGRLLAPDEYLWYTRDVELDPKPDERILLHFGAVDYRAVVYLGHDEVAVHDGGNLPFTADITPYAKRGVNRLSVLVWDPTEDFVQARGKQAFKSHACFYTRSSGIIQTVWLETVPETYIADYCVTTDIDKGEVTLTFRGMGNVSPERSEPRKRSLEGWERETGNGEKGTVEILCGSAPLRETFIPGIPCTIRLPAPVALWSPEDPNLYSFTARYGADEIKGYFGMRKFEKRKDAKGVWRFFLNNRPYYVMATLDQGWWPDGLLTPPSEEAMAFDIQTLKDCGFNAMRKHIKVEPLRYYALCDRLGLLVLQDMPCTSFDAQATYKAESVKGYGLFREELKGMIDLLRKVPSIVMWIPYNEGWGQHDPLLTHTTLDFVKRYDPTRLVDGPSGWNDFEGGERRNPKGYRVEPILWKTAHQPESECEASDIVDLHRYRGPVMPEVNSRRVSFLGEFGGLGHPVDGHLWDTSPKDARGNWGYGGIEDTKTREGLEKTYLGLMDKLGELAEAGLAGSVYTQTTDVEIEINGLLTYDRKVLKHNPEVLRKAHAEVIRRALDAPRTTASR